MLLELLSVALLLLGALLLLVAAIGVVRMPDVLLRMSAVSKASSLGASLMLIGAALALWDGGAAARALAGTLFLFLTAPVASHLVGRAAYRLGVPLWKGTAVDDFRSYEERRTRAAPGEVQQG